MRSLEVVEEVLLAPICTLEKVCVELSRFFGVRQTEIGVLRLEDEFLRFLYPTELQTAGRIPLSGPAIAARTASNRTSEFFNNFAHVPHRTVFELVKLKDPDLRQDEHLPIQKLMSAPILGRGDELLGVIQVSRKGFSPGTAGVDFNQKQLRDLERAARRIAALRPELLEGNPKKPRWRLELQNEQKKKTPTKRAKI